MTKAIDTKSVAVTSQDDVQELIMRAIDKGTPVETMERLMAMRRELKEEWAKEEYNRAMATFQSKCPIIDKNAVAGNAQYGYKYATLDHIVSTVRDLLSECGFSYTFDSEKTDHSLITICHVKHTAGHSESSRFEINVDTGAKMNISQKDGSASTYGKRYAFCNAFGILTGDEDTDANEVKEEEHKPVLHISQYQVGKIYNLLQEKGKTEDDLAFAVKSAFKKDNVQELTRDEGLALIRKLESLTVTSEEEEVDIDEVDEGIKQGKVK